MRVHRAWLVAGVTFLVLLASAAFRSSIGVMLEPIESDLGWTRTQTSLAASLNLVVYGLTAPFAASVMELVGVRRVAVGALGLICAGSALTVTMTAAWQLYLLWGVVIGLGTGSVALVFGSIIVNRWFLAHRGMALGVLGSAWATGQVFFLPILASITESAGWRTTSLVICAAALALVPLVLVVLRDRPSDVGLAPLGAPSGWVADSLDAPASAGEAIGGAIRVLVDASRTRAFLLLAGTFFICGWTTNGIISTHFVSAAHDHGMASTTAAGLLAVVGVFDILGTLASGWLTDRVDPRWLLAGYYGLRGVALLAVPMILGPTVAPPLVLVVVLFGLDWVATVPPTVTLCSANFGVERGGIVFGWVFAAHMIGGGVAAIASGLLRTSQGDYASAWLLAGVLAIVAAAAATTIPRGTRTPVLVGH